MLCCRGCATRASARMAFADLRRIESTSTPGTKTENAMADLIKLETGHGPGSWVPRPHRGRRIQLRSVFEPKVTLKFLKADARWKAWDRALGPEIMSCPVVTRAKARNSRSDTHPGHSSPSLASRTCVPSCFAE
jgi:hypothetical protein